jgi:hypothetical protein
MEQRLNKSGDRRGLHGKAPRGAANVKSKGWILYKDGEEVGYFASLSECAQVTKKSKQYMWILAHKRAINSDGPRLQTQEGWSIKPAQTIEYKAK